MFGKTALRRQSGGKNNCFFIAALKKKLEPTESSAWLTESLGVLGCVIKLERNQILEWLSSERGE